MHRQAIDPKNMGNNGYRDSMKDKMGSYSQGKVTKEMFAAAKQNFYLSLLPIKSDPLCIVNNGKKFSTKF